MLTATGPAQVRVSWLGCSSEGKDPGFPVDRELNASQQCSLVAVKAGHALGCTWERRTRTVNTPPFCAGEAASLRTASSRALQCNHPSGILNEMQSSERSQRPLGLEQKRLPRQGSDWSLQYLKEGWREDRFFLLGHSKRQWTEVVAREVPLGQKKTLFHSKGGSWLARVPRKLGNLHHWQCCEIIFMRP